MKTKSKIESNSNSNHSKISSSPSTEQADQEETINSISKSMAVSVASSAEIT